MKIDEETKDEIRKYLKDSGVIALMKNGYVFDFGVLTPFVKEFANIPIPLPQIIWSRL